MAAGFPSPLHLEGATAFFASVTGHVPFVRFLTHEPRALSETGLKMRQMGQVHSATPRSVGRARRAVSEFAGGVGGDSETVGAIELAVSEACNNVAVHAYRDSSSPGEMVVLASEAHGRLEIQVIDHGVGLTPRFDSPGIGMGLPLMSRLADSFEAQSSGESGTEIRMEFALDRASGSG